MPLKEIRDKFVALCGRRDFINDDESDNGADYYINAGQRFLDRELVRTGMRHRGRHVIQLPGGAYYFHVPDALVMEQVWAINSAGAKRQLIKASYVDLIDSTAPVPVTSVDGLMPPIRTTGSNSAGCPLFWAESPARVSPEQNVIEMQQAWGERFGLDAVLIGHGWKWRTIVLSPGLDQTYSMQVIGWFGSGRLENDYDQSWWSEEHPETLVRAALYNLEADYRNSEGMKDWLASIMQTLTSLDNMSAMEESANIE